MATTKPAPRIPKCPNCKSINKKLAVESWYHVECLECVYTWITAAKYKDLLPQKKLATRNYS